MRLIDADALVDAIKSEIAEDKELYPYKDWIKYFDSGMRNVIRLVKRLPAQDPVKHGHWIFTGRTYKCSNCCLSEDNAVEADPCDLPMLNFKYCPHRGARMDGDAND